MLPALSTKPKQAMRQVKGLTNDSIDAYSNTPIGGGSTVTSYADNTVAASNDGNLSARTAAISSSKSMSGGGRSTARKGHHGDEDSGGGVLARVVRDRKASGDEELGLKVGDVVRVLSSKRTGYLKFEFGDQEGYVPSSYLEFFDDSSGTGAAGGHDPAETGDENQRVEKRKKKKEKHHKKKKLATAAASDVDDTMTLSAKSPRKTGGNGESVGGDGDASSPHKSRKKSARKHHDDTEALDSPRRSGGDDTERRKEKARKSKKKRHHDSSESSESDGDGGGGSSRHRKNRSHRRSRRRGRGRTSGSDSSSAADSDNSSSDSGYSRRRRRHRHHRKGSSSDEDEYDTDKRKDRHSSRRRGHGGSGDSDADEHDTARSSRRSDKKHERAMAAETSTPRSGGGKAERERDAGHGSALEKGVAKLDVHGSKHSSRGSDVISDHSPDQETAKKTDGTSGVVGTAKDRDDSTTKTARSKKDDEGRAEASAVTGHKTKTNLGKQIGEKMRSLLGGGKKTERSHKSSSGILNACPGTVQGEEGWYEHGENERYYFVLLDSKWSLLYGPMTEEDFDAYSSKVPTHPLLAAEECWMQRR